MKRSLTIAKNVLLGLSLATVVCSFIFMEGWKAAKDQNTYKQYYACDYQLPMDCFLYENFTEYRMDENGRSIPFITPPGLVRSLPNSIEWYLNHPKDWKEIMSLQSLSGIRMQNVYAYNIMGVLEAGTTFRVLQVYEYDRIAFGFNKNIRRLLIEILTGPFAGYKAITGIYVDGELFRIPTADP